MLKVKDGHPDVNFRCWLDEILRGIGVFRESLLKCHKAFHYESLQKYVEMIYFYFNKVILLKEHPQDIPTYDYPHLFAQPEEKASIKKPKQQELIYDEGGFQRIKTMSQDESSPNVPTREKERQSKNLLT